MSQLVKNPPAMWNTWVRSLGREDPLEKGKDALQYSGLENSIVCIVHGVAKSQTWLSNFQSVNKLGFPHWVSKLQPQFQMGSLKVHIFSLFLFSLVYSCEWERLSFDMSEKLEVQLIPFCSPFLVLLYLPNINMLDCQVRISVLFPSILIIKE